MVACADLLGAIESNSSKKRTQGLAALARSNRSRTFRKSVNERSKAVRNTTCRLLTCSDVFVQKLRTFDADKVEPALFRHCRREKSFATTGKSVKKQAVFDNEVTVLYKHTTCTYPDRKRSGDFAKIGPYLVGHSSVSRRILRVSFKPVKRIRNVQRRTMYGLPPISDQATSDFCSLISRSDRGTKSTCATSKSLAVRVIWS